MAYNVKTTRAGQSRRSRCTGFVWTAFRALFRLMGVTLVLAGSLGFVLLISIALLFGYNTAIHSDFFGLKKIEISGNSQLTHSQLKEIMEVNPGDSLLQIRVGHLYSRLAANPWVEHASIKRVFPDTLVISIQEKQAYFWVQDQGGLYYADEKGRIITGISPERYVSLPVLQVEAGGTCSDVEDVLRFLENRRFPFSLQDVSWVRVVEPDKILMRIDSHGLIVDVDQNLLESGPARLNMVWSDLAARGEVDSVDRILIAGRNAWVGYRQE